MSATPHPRSAGLTGPTPIRTRVRATIDQAWARAIASGTLPALPGEQPVFAVRPPNSLQTTPARWGNLRDRWATTYDASIIKNTRIREGMNAQFRFEAFNATNTAVVAASSDPSSVLVGTLPADKAVTVQWQATVDPQGQPIHNPSNQGTVSGTNFTSLNTNTQ